MKSPINVFRSVLFFLILVGLFVSPSYGQYNNGISGFVYNAAGQPVSDVYVELQNEYGSAITRTKTGGSGFYSFRRLNEGQYKLKVQTFGTNYLEQIRSVSLIGISAVPGSGGINQQMDFHLQIDRKFLGPLAAPEVIFAQDVPSKAEKLYNEAIRLIAEEKDDKGFEKLIEAIEVFPEYFAALDRLGTEYIEKNYDRPAYVLLRKAIEVNPKTFSSRLGLGIAQFRLKQINESVETLKEAVSIYGNSVTAHLWLGIGYHAIGDLTAADNSLSRANQLSSKRSPAVHWQLARLYNAQKRYGEAARELELYLKYDENPDNAEKIKGTISKLKQMEINN